MIGRDWKKAGRDWKKVGRDEERKRRKKAWKVMFLIPTQRYIAYCLNNIFPEQHFPGNSFFLSASSWFIRYNP